MRIHDTPPRAVRDMDDVFRAVIFFVLAAAVVAIAALLQSSIKGMESDVHRVSELSSLHWIVELPVSFLQSLSLLIIVSVVLVRLLIQRAWWPTLAATLSLGAGLALSGLITWLLPMWIPALGIYFRAPASDLLGVGPIEMFTAVAAFLIGASSQRSSRSLNWAWNWYAILMVIEIIASTIELPSALFSVLLGSSLGLLVRFGFGTQSTGAWGQRLVDALSGIGIEIDKLSLQKTAEDRTSFSDDLAESSRLYHAEARDGERLTISVIDAQHHSRGYLSQLWQRLKIQGLSTRQDRTVRDAVEHHFTMLQALSALRLPVPHVRAMGDTGESSFLVFDSPQPGRHAHPLDLGQASDEQAIQLMRELEKAHRCGITHRDITAADIGVIPAQSTERDETMALTKLTRKQLLAGSGSAAASESDMDSESGTIPSSSMAGQAVIDGWSHGDLASSQLHVLVDRVQLLSLLAVTLGVDRTVRLARSVYSDASLAELAPYFQSVVIPSVTRQDPKWNRQIPRQLHDRLSALVEQTVSTEAEPIQFARFSWKRLISILLLLIALVALFTQLNFDEMLRTIREANPWWALASLAFGIVSWLGSALAFGIFIPKARRKHHWAGIVGTQAVASFTAVSMPTAAGPLTVNTLFLRKIGFDNTSAIATATADTLAEFGTTLLMFLVLGLFTGRSGLQDALPGKTILIVVGAIAAIIAIVMIVPPWRRWVITKWGKPLREYGRQIANLFSHPRILAISAFGSVIQNTTLAAAFWVCLLAFGYRLDFIVTLFLFLLSNAIGSAVPTPGGLGAVETVVSLTFVGVGVPSSAAVSATLLFRLMTYWMRMVFGYVYMKWMQHHNYL